MRMGANGSYSKAIGGVPENKRTHTDSGYKIAGHKVVLQTSDNQQAKNIMNSNSANPIYIIGHRKNDGSIEIHSVNIFDGHHINVEINMKYDSSGRIRPYNGKESGTHCHRWEIKPNGDMGRVLTGSGHDKVPAKYNRLLNQIVQFNNKNKK